MIENPLVVDAKHELRQQFLARRTVAKNELGEGANESFAHHLVDILQSHSLFVSGTVLAAYWPIKSEIGTESFLQMAIQQNIRCCLPVVEGEGQALSFRQWSPETKLIKGKYGVLTPPDCPENNDILSPQVIIVPLVAFDDKGGRLGYGGGYYDRTLELLRQNEDILALGAAFSCQQVDKLPIEPHDQKLDGVVTEKGSIKF